MSGGPQSRLLWSQYVASGFDRGGEFLNRMTRKQVQVDDLAVLDLQGVGGNARRLCDDDVRTSRWAGCGAGLWVLPKRGINPCASGEDSSECLRCHAFHKVCRLAATCRDD